MGSIILLLQKQWKIILPLWSVCWSICLPVHQSVCLSINSSACPNPSACLFIHRTAHLAIHLSAGLSIFLHLPVYLSIYLTAYLAVCLCVYPICRIILTWPPKSQVLNVTLPLFMRRSDRSITKSPISTPTVDIGSPDINRDKKYTDNLLQNTRLIVNDSHLSFQ